LDLFGVSVKAPLARLDCQGLVSFLALTSQWERRLVAVEPDRALLRPQSGDQQVFRPGKPTNSDMVLWWTCHTTTGISHNAARRQTA
jgi:hypothetical protein